MASETRHELDVPDAAAVQHSMLEQARAAVDAQNETGIPQQYTAYLQQTDLMTPEATEDEMPPPPYGNTYGEIRNEKDGLDTSANVTSDGRVNIQINQLNRRLSQIFTPALRDHLQSAQESQPPPEPYIPPSLGGGKEGVDAPPALNVVIQVVGSRGDVQPFVALGKVLKETYGHRVRLATHPNFKKFVEDNGLEFFSIGGDPARLMAFMVQNPSLMPGFRSIVTGQVSQRRRDVAEYIQGCWRSCYQTGDGMESSMADGVSETSSRPFVADCIIANPPSFAHIHCAEKMGIPVHIHFTMPYSPTQAFPHPLANVQSSNADPQLTNYLSYAMIERLSWQGLGELINRFRVKCLGLDPVSLIWAPGMLQRLKIPHTYCWSPALIPKPKDWGSHISISGFYFLNLASSYQPPSDLKAFLEAGPPPVYIGFGSIVLDDPNAMTELIFQTAKKTGQRVLLSKGWGGMGADDLNVPDGVFMLGNVPHDWLFKQVSCVVHHGGAGTTAAGITAGRPTVIVPFFGDQPFWGSMVARAGAGPDPIPHKKLTADGLADAISFCLLPESLERAKELAGKIAAERGTDTGAQLFHQFLEPDRLRCNLVPSRPAVWRIRKTNFRLSAFAACTLVNAKMLQFKDLKMFRPQEYETDKGPWDPISGGFVTACGAATDMAMGLADLPTETIQALQYPFKYGQNRSRTSISTTSESQQPSVAEQSSTPPTSTEQSRKNSEGANLMSPVSTAQSTSDVDNRVDRLSLKLDASSKTRVQSRNESASNQQRDLLYQRGIHTDKGIGRFSKALVQSPMTLSTSLSRGLHNMPRLWGDDTVRPQSQVGDFKSGVTAAGKEFGLGMYDGVAGLVTQPWRGAKKDGIGGFFKGVGKGVGGFLPKQAAGTIGILSYTMKGVHKEIQKSFGANVQSYIIASRTAQGYEEWLQGSEAEIEDVIVRWKLIEKYVKKRRDNDEVIRDILRAQQNGKPQASQATCSAQAGSIAPGPTPRSNIAVGEGSLSADVSSNVRESQRDQDAYLHDPQEPGAGRYEIQQAVQENVSRLVQQRRDVAEYEAYQEDLRQAMIVSKAQVEQDRQQDLDYEQQLERAMQQSAEGQWSDNHAAMTSAGHEEHDMEANPGADPARASTSQPQTTPLDAGHISGISQREFEAQQRREGGEKTAQEKMEEKIVLEYIKKQSLLEEQHRDKGKGRALQP